MKKKIIRHILLLAGIISAMFLFTSCSNEKTEPEQNFEDLPLDDFTAATSNIMTEAPEGYYIVTGNFLYYVSSDFQESTIVCSKPDCVHNDTDVKNLYDYTSCDAYFFDARQIDYYDGYLYVSNWNGTGTDIYRVSLDGTERTLFYQGQVDCMFSIYNGYAYFGEAAYTTEGKIHKLTACPVEDPDKTEVLFETDEYPDATMNRMRFYHGNCYFYLFDSAFRGEEGDSIYWKINLQDGKAEQMYEQSDCRMEWNDYGILAEVKDYITFDPTTQWTSKYYHIDPDSGEKTELTENDFSAIGTNDAFTNMDDKYIYFRTTDSDGNELTPEEQKIKVYDYEGNLQAEIPTKDVGEMIWILPGTDEHLFIQTTVREDGSYALWYVDKSEFNGSTVEPQKIELAGRG